jgi:hypothetical protein
MAGGIDRSPYRGSILRIMLTLALNVSFKSSKSSTLASSAIHSESKYHGELFRLCFDNEKLQGSVETEGTTIKFIS